MSIRVRIEHGQGAGTTWRLTQPGVYRIGRTKDNSIQVLDMKVSKAHCEIHLGKDGTSALLHDLGSTHGAMVNGQPLSGDTPLKAGDELRLGLTILRVLSDGAADHDLAPMTGRSVDESSVDTSGATPEARTKHSLPPDDLVGKDLDGYLIEGKIGAGGMGGVYLAEQISLKRKVALKVLNERFGSDSAFVDQFVNEARAAGALNHPNVVQVYDVGSADGHYFFSMEVMPGGSIEDRVKANDVEWQDALNWFIDAANALIFAHKKEILHRDVKPDNLMLAEDGSAKLCDLGLAKKSENADLMAQGIIGTPHFISPEAIRRKPDINHRTDLYSLGCSFYRILTGRNPYPGKTVKEILLGHLNKPVPVVSERNGDVPRDLVEVVQKLMQKDPAERFQTPEELLQSLDKVRLRHGLEAHGIRPHSRKPVIIAGAAALLIAIGAVAWVSTREPEVVVKPKTAEQIAEEREQAITEVRLAVDKAKLDPPAKFHYWDKTVTDKDLPGSGDEWKDKFWTDVFLPQIRDTADGWAGTATGWLDQAKKEEHEEAVTLLTDGATFMNEQATKARELADKHQRYIEKRRTNEKAITTARIDANKKIDEDISAHDQAINKALEDKRYIEAAVRLRKRAVDDLVQPYRDLKKLDVQLLKQKDIDARIKKAFGVLAKDGPFKGYYRAGKLMAARKEIHDAHQARMATAKVDGSATVEELTAAIKALAEYLKEFGDKPTPQAGVISSVLTLQKESVERALGTAKRLVYRRQIADLRGDRKGCQDLFRTLFAPRTATSTGNLRRYDFLSAELDAKSFADGAKTDEYKMIGAHMLRAIEGMRAAFERAKTTFPKDWSDTKYTELDKRGKTRTRPFKEVSAEGFRLGKDEYKYGQWQPHWILTNLFFVDNKPRFILEGNEMLGLAMLAELAGDYDLARKTYEDYATGVGGDAKKGVEWRLAVLDNEAKADRLWRKSAKVAADLKEFNDKHDPKKIGEQAFEKIKDEVFDAKREFAPRQQEAMAIRHQLQNDPELAVTLRGAGVRIGDPHPDGAFAGEVAPEDPGGGAPPPRDGDTEKNEPPKKDAGGDGEVKKDGGGEDKPAGKDASDGTNGDGKGK